MSTKPNPKKAIKPAVKKSVSKKSAAKKPAVKTAEAPKPAATPAPKAPKAAKRGVRYTPELKKEVVDFVNSYNSQKGRGGQSAAARKYKITILTVSSWLKGAGTSKASSAAAPKGLTTKIKSLLDLADAISKAESQLAKLKSQHAALSASIRSQI